MHPGELWVSKQRVHIALEASKSAGAKGDVQKICGCVQRIPWSEHVLIYLLPILFQHCACNAWGPRIVQERVDLMLLFLSLILIWNFIWILAYKCIYLLKTDIYSQYFVDFKSVSWWFRLQRFCWTIFSLLRKVTSKVGDKRVALWVLITELPMLLEQKSKQTALNDRPEHYRFRLLSCLRWWSNNQKQRP